MKSFYSIIILLIVSGSLSLAQQSPMHIHRENEMRRYELLAKRDVYVPASMAAYDVTHYQLFISLEEGSDESFNGDVIMTFSAVDAGLNAVDLHLASNCRFDSVVTRDQRIDNSALVRNGDVVTIPLPYQLQAGESSSLHMYYNGTYVRSAITRRDVFNHDIMEMTTSIATQSEPFDARTWWPCKDDPSDKADSMDIYINISNSLTPISNGLLISDSDNNDGTHTVHWKTTYPIATYLVCVAAAKYNHRGYEFMHSGRTMRVDNWWYGGSANNMLPFEQDMFDGLQFFSDLFIPYPFMNEKYAMAEYEWSGAMEHQTVSSMGFYSTEVVIHELMHQWFGDKVTCNSFHHIWLNEGWATYGEALFEEFRYGHDGLKAMMSEKVYFGPGTIYVDDLTEFSRIFDGNLTYNKAAWALHMLRHVMGDDVFFRAVRNYLGDESPENYRSVVTSEFQQFMEDESGMDLEWFFRQWIYGEFYPTYQISWQAGIAGANYQLDVDIEQLYQTERQLFTMPIDLYIRFPDNSDTTIVIFNDKAEQQWSITLPKKPVVVRLDPDNWILRRVIEKFPNPTFDKGLLLVNGVDWNVNFYHDALHVAFSDSTFTGGQPYTLWDLFPNPSGGFGYPEGVPAPIGYGPIPAQILGQYCTVVWLGNAYNRDEADWANTSVMEYIKSGGNLILITRYGQQFLSADMVNFLGITWNGQLATIRECKAALPSLIDMDFTDTQSLVNPFELKLRRSENVLLFTENYDGDDFGIGVWGKPMLFDEKLTGHMMFLSLRPYYLEPAHLKQNMKTLLNEMPCEALSISNPATITSLKLHSVYPNPSSASMLRTAPLSVQNNTTAIKLSIYDVLGRAVREVFHGTLQPGEYNMVVELSGLPVGVYSLVLQNNTLSVSQPILITE